VRTPSLTQEIAVFVTLKRDYLGHKASATLDIHEVPVGPVILNSAQEAKSPHL
jgi:hypothetical protein